MATLTLSVWIYYTADVKQGGIYGDYGGASGNDLNLVLENPESVYIRADKSPGTLKMSLPLSRTLKGRWHHLAWTLEKDQSILYVDGEKEAAVQQVGTYLGHHSESYVGYSVNAFFQGMLDDFRIWDRSLTASV